MKSWDTLDADVNLIMTKHFTQGREGRRADAPPPPDLPEED